MRLNYATTLHPSMMTTRPVMMLTKVIRLVQAFSRGPSGSSPAMDRRVDPAAIGVPVIVPVTACRGEGQQGKAGAEATRSVFSGHFVC
jgi:hypothetical protein